MKETDFETYKLAGYVCSAIRKIKRGRELRELCEWLEDDGRDIFGIEFKGKSGFKRRHEKDGGDNADNTKETRVFLAEAAKALEERFLAKEPAPSGLERTLRFISKSIGLTKTESEYLGLTARYRVEKNVEDFVDELYPLRRFFGKELTCGNFLSVKSSFDDLRKAWRKMGEIGLTDGDFEDYAGLSDFTATLLSEEPKTYDGFRKIFLGATPAARLKWEDFAYVEKRDEMCALLKAAVARKEKGINILLYGPPGTGKTEFARTLARRAGVRLYSIAEKRAERRRGPSCRTTALLFSQKIAAPQKGVCLLLDEAEDVFFDDNGRSMTKIEMNAMLENNETPVIWTTNRIMDADKAFLRRFSYSERFETPDRERSVRIWQKTLRKNKLPSGEKIAGEMARLYPVPPAYIANAVRNERLIGGGIETVKSSLDNMRELCGGEGPLAADDVSAVVPFDPALLKTDVDLGRLAERIASLKLKTFSLCLYGAPGTGKSAYAAWLAEKIGRPVVKKRCSDLFGMFVGETEKNIRRAFAEAAAKNAVLIFDEADSFLQDRRGAVRSWETTQVNEMLTQMESARHPFICTTNLLDRLDQASLRRFTFKVKYDFMGAEQRSKAFETFFGFKGEDLSGAENLTPADFALVYKKAKILGVLNDRTELLKMLRAEQDIKAPPKFKMGF